MTFDCLAFYESTTNDGLLPVAPAPGEPHGYVVDGDNLQMKWAGQTLACLGISAAVANFVQFRIGTQDFPRLKWSETQTFCRDQTGGKIDPMQQNDPYWKNSLMNVDFDHGNNAQVACVVFLVSDGTPMLYFNERPSDIPKTARWVVATSVTTKTAGAWTEDIVTYTYNWNVAKYYDVYALRGHSGTGYAFRIHPQDSPYKYRPGLWAGDTKLLCDTVYSKSPMFSFSGLTPPTIDWLCSGADTTDGRVEMLIVDR
jgi:hypothetical protein